MKSKVIIFLTGIIVILFLGGSSFQSSKEEAGASSKSCFNFVDEKIDEDICPYIQQKNRANCPYLNELIENSKSPCPYLSGKAKCPYTGKVIQSPPCPYLNQDSKDNGNKEKNYNMIKNTSI